MPATAATICSSCHCTSSSLSRCTGCLSVSYCNSSCQRSAWPKHKLVCRKPKQVPTAPTPLSVPSLFLQAGNVLLDRLEAAASLGGNNFLHKITDYLTSHMQGVQSSSIRQALLKQILSGHFPSKSEYKVCQMRNYKVCSMGQMHSVYYRDLDMNKIDTFETELEVDEEDVLDVLDTVEMMICMVISGDIPIIDLGRLYVVEALSGKAVKMNVSGVPVEDNEAGKEAFENFVMDKTGLLQVLSNSLHNKERELDHPPSFKLTKLDITTLEMFHNCHSSNIPEDTMVRDLCLDLVSLISIFPLSGRTLASLTDLRLGNCLTNMFTNKGNADELSQRVLAGVGHCCPSLKVLDIRGSEVNPAIIIWLLLKDPFIALHKYCFSVYKGGQGETEIRKHKEDCIYCKDQDGEDARKVKKVTMEEKRYHWSPLADDVWEILEKNDWHFVSPDENVEEEKFDKRSLEKDCSDANSNWEPSDKETTSEENENKDIIASGIKAENIEIEGINCDLSDSEEDEVPTVGKVLNDWKIVTSPALPLLPKIHVLSASALINCISEVNSSPCNPLVSTLEVLYISGNAFENLLTEAVFPFLLKACPNLKIMGDSFAALKGLRLFSTMKLTSNSVTDLRELDMVYPSTHDRSGAEPSVGSYLMFGPHNYTVSHPTSDNLSALLPCVPMTMMSSEHVAGFPALIGWLNSDNISLIDLYLKENPLKDITDPLVLGEMVKEDCYVVAKVCPNLTTLKISLDHPWGVPDKAHLWAGLAPLSLTTLQVTDARWENVSPLLQVVGMSLTDVHILLPKRNNALQGEIDSLSQLCPMLESLYLGIGTSPLEVRDLDMFKGFQHLKTVYIGEAFTWKSFQALVSLSPNLEKVQVDKMNEHVVGKPPNVVITDMMVKELGKLMKLNGAGKKVKVLSFSWVDLDKEKLVETLQTLLSVFPALKWLGTLALGKRELSVIKVVVTMAKEDGIVINMLDTEVERQPGAEYEGLPTGEECCIS